jgi:NAD(P)H-dependent FMN reductase
MITIVVGTNRRRSKSKQVALFYQKLLSDLNAESQLLDIADLPDDFIRSALYENNGKNELFNTFRRMMHESDKYV